MVRWGLFGRSVRSGGFVSSVVGNGLYSGVTDLVYIGRINMNLVRGRKVFICVFCFRYCLLGSWRSGW